MKYILKGKLQHLAFIVLIFSLSFILSADAGSVDEHNLMVSNLLVAPKAFSKCIFTVKQLQARDAKGEPEYANNCYCTGYYDNSNYYVLQYRNPVQAQSCQNLLEAHGHFGPVVWRWGGGILLMETNSLKSEEAKGWIRMASDPLKLGIAPLQLGSVHFTSAADFEAEDFLGNKANIAAALICGSPASANASQITYTIRGSTNHTKSLITLQWGGTNAFPSKISRQVNSINRYETEIYELKFMDPDAAIDFAPEKILSCKLLILARGTEDGKAATVYDNQGNLLKTTITKINPEKKNKAFIFLIALFALSFCVFLVPARNKTTTI